DPYGNLPIDVTPSVVGPYAILSQLGEGGMGMVYKARHQKLGRVVALKVIRPEKLGNAELQRRFLREVLAASRLDHPNVVHAFDAGMVGDAAYIAMEFVEGGDLARRLREQGPLPVAEAVGYVVQALRGLQHAHERGLVHRDVKPSNLIRTKEGTVKVLDLG